MTATSTAHTTTVDTDRVSPKVVTGSIAATIASGAAAFVLSQLGRWSLFDSLEESIKGLVGAALIALFTGLIAFAVGHGTKYAKAVYADATAVLGPDAAAAIRADVTQILRDELAAHAQDTAVPPPAPAPTVVLPAEAEVEQLPDTAEAGSIL